MVEDSSRREFNLMWLPTTAERIIGDLLTDASILDEAATGILTADERAALVRSQDAPWTTDDLPLLDEAADALGPWEPPSAAPPDVPDYRELQASDAYQIRPSHSSGNAGSLAERAIDDREWIYGHVIVDEAQELSAMAWRAIRRRASRRSMTVVDDPTVVSPCRSSHLGEHPLGSQQDGAAHAHGDLPITRRSRMWPRVCCWKRRRSTHGPYPRRIGRG